jgi:hypothetical protein
MQEGTTRAVILPFTAMCFRACRVTAGCTGGYLATEGASSLGPKRQHAVSFALVVPHPRVSFAYFERPCP